MNPKIVLKVLGLAFAGSLFIEGATDVFGLGELHPFVRMVLAMIIVIIVINI